MRECDLLLDSRPFLILQPFGWSDMRLYFATPLLVLFLFVSALPAQAVDLNGFRRQNGLKPMSANATLTGLAKAHAADMARRHSMDHANFFEVRARRGAAGENVTVGCADSGCAMQMWINSGPHRANMLRPDFRRYGLGSATSASGQRYWALVLGR
jgi:uncharacterized protein YkwD